MNENQQDTPPVTAASALLDAGDKTFPHKRHGIQLLKCLKLEFNLKAIKTKALTLLIEHGPCCILSFAAGFIGLPFLNHNPMVELGFAFGGAIAGEYIGHKYFEKNHTHKLGWKATVRRYGLSLVFGLASWGVHQVAFHEDPTEHTKVHTHATQQYADPHKQALLDSEKKIISVSHSLRG